MRPVTVQFLKNPDLQHWGFETIWLGEDEWGDWMAVPAGSARWKGLEEVRPTRERAVFWKPRDRWWHLHYNGLADTSEYTHFVDICTPPAWVGDDRYEMIDLDLDVAVHNDGTIEVQDEDEFAVHQVRYAYSEEMIREARAATELVARMLGRREEPFFDVADSWLAKVT